MKKLCLVLVVFCFGFVCFEARAQQSNAIAPLSALEQGILSEFTRVRSDPTAYAQWIETNMRSLPYAPKNLDKSVVKEAIRELRRTKPLPTLTFSEGLRKAAMDHVKDQVSKGSSFSHTGTDGSSPIDRIKRYGTFSGIASENAIFLHSDSAEAMVLGWIIDNFDPRRGHRRAILNPNLHFTGVACGTNPASSKTAGATFCVADFAKEYRENPDRSKAWRVSLIDQPACPFKTGPPLGSGFSLLDARVSCAC